jgi:hypothetical protein
MASRAIQPVPLAQETRAAIPTAEAAHHLSRSKQTLWLWSCKESGPIRPVRVNGHLAWKVADIKRVLDLEVA